MNISFISQFMIEHKHHILSFRLDFSDWQIGKTVSRSKASTAYSFGPFHIAYTDTKKMFNYFEMSLQESEENYGQLPREMGTSDAKGEGIIH